MRGWISNTFCLIAVLLYLPKWACRCWRIGDRVPRRAGCVSIVLGWHCCLALTWHKHTQTQFSRPKTWSKFCFVSSAAFVMNVTCNFYYALSPIRRWVIMALHDFHTFDLLTSLFIVVSGFLKTFPVAHICYPWYSQLLRNRFNLVSCRQDINCW